MKSGKLNSFWFSVFYRYSTFDTLPILCYFVPSNRAVYFGRLVSAVLQNSIQCWELIVYLPGRTPQKLAPSWSVIWGCQQNTWTIINYFSILLIQLSQLFFDPLNSFIFKKFTFCFLQKLSKSIMKQGCGPSRFKEAIPSDSIQLPTTWEDLGLFPHQTVKWYYLTPCDACLWGTANCEPEE